MIFPTTDSRIIDKLLPLVLQVPDLPYSPHGYINYIKETIAGDCGIVLININESHEIDGFCFAETIIAVTDREVMLNLAYMSKDELTVGKEMWDILEKWAKMKECKRICCITKPSKSNALIRKYGFDHKWNYLTKELIYGRG